MMDDADRENLSNEAAAVRLSSCLTMVRSAVLMLVAPLVVVVALRFILPSAWPNTGWIACILAGVIGLLGIIFAPWRESVKVAAAGTYMLGALVVLPFVWVGSALIVPREGLVEGCASRFGDDRAVRDAHEAVQRSDSRLIKIIKEAVVVTVEAPGLSATNCPNPKRLALEDDATSRLLSEGNFREDSLPTACEETARKYAAIYNREIVKFRPKVLAGFCMDEGSVR